MIHERRPRAIADSHKLDEWQTVLVGGVLVDVVGPPPGELYSETNDNSVAILLTYGTARVLLVGDAEASQEGYTTSGSYTRP
jgi:beta-lactamase superfamily II metal-dependent hydrolase